MKTNKIIIILILVGVTFIVINAVDVFLGYKITHGKGFQIIGIGLIVIGLIITLKLRLDK